MRAILIASYYAVVGLHWAAFILLLSALPGSIVAYFAGTMPIWMVAVVWTLVIRTARSPNICPLSELECAVARRIGYPEKHLFIKYHVIPAVRMISRKAAAIYNKHLYKY